MIDINKIIENKEGVIKGLLKRNTDYTDGINIAYDNTTIQRQLQLVNDELRHKFNLLNKTNDPKDIPLKRELKAEIKKNDDHIKELDTLTNDILINIPNILHDDVSGLFTRTHSYESYWSPQFDEDETCKESIKEVSDIEKQISDLKDKLLLATNKMNENRNRIVLAKLEETTVEDSVKEGIRNDISNPDSEYNKRSRRSFDLF